MLARCPSLTIFAFYLHSEFIKLLIAGANLAEPPVLSCAWGPLLFAVVLQPSLDHLATHHADAACAAYTDAIVV